MIASSSHHHDPLTALIRSPSTAIQVSCSQEALSSFDWSDFPIVGPCCVEEEDLTYRPPVTYQPSYSAFETYKTSCHVARLTGQSRLANYANSMPTVGVKNPARKPNKQVKFSPILEIHSHPVVLGDHPCCAGGLALEIDWVYEVEIVDFEVHERFSSKHRQHELRLSYADRRQRLCESTGMTGSELLQHEYEMVCGGARVLHHIPTVRRALMAS